MPPLFAKMCAFSADENKNARIAGRGKRCYTGSKNGIMCPARIPARRAAAKEKV